MGSIDPRSYRRVFAAIWQRSLHLNFEDAVEVAHVFKVDATTAEKWWQGANAPSGWVVAFALAASMPECEPRAVQLVCAAQLVGDL